MMTDASNTQDATKVKSAREQKKPDFFTTGNVLITGMLAFYIFLFVAAVYKTILNEMILSGYGALIFMVIIFSNVFLAIAVVIRLIQFHVELLQYKKLN